MKLVMSLSLAGAVSLLSSLAQAASPPKPTHMVSEAQARKAALAAYLGDVKGSELEFEGGRWVYSYDIADSGGNGSIHEIQVDAGSGKIVSKKIESAQDEQAEQRHESGESK